MCLFAWTEFGGDSTALCKLFIFQRDESYLRPTLPCGFHFTVYNEKYSDVLGTADLQNPPGSFLAVNIRTGALAALTNVRRGLADNNPSAKGRGHIVLDLVCHDKNDMQHIIGHRLDDRLDENIADGCGNTSNYDKGNCDTRMNSISNFKCNSEVMRKIQSNVTDYNHFNLILTNLNSRNGKDNETHSFSYFNSELNLLTNFYEEKDCATSNRNTKKNDAAFFHVLSNSRLDDFTWPRVTNLKKDLEQFFSRSSITKWTVDNVAELMVGLYNIMSNRTVIPDKDLPCTGGDLEWERQLAPIFADYKTKKFGSRSCTIIVVFRNRLVKMSERFIINDNVDNFVYKYFSFTLGDPNSFRETNDDFQRHISTAKQQSSM